MLPNLRTTVNCIAHGAGRFAARTFQPPQKAARLWGCSLNPGSSWRIQPLYFKLTAADALLPLHALLLLFVPDMN
jgi:hypothetical protein